MSKRAKSVGRKQDQRIPGEATPPLLSEELIAQLQNAVSAAQRRRTPGPDEHAEFHHGTERGDVTT